MSYILITGAPGSMWSSVYKNINGSPDLDTTDLDAKREYWRQGQLMHSGAYFDPGMEYENNIENWDKPFSGLGIRIIKSHNFSHRLNQLCGLGYPIVMVHRNDYECYKWWQNAGGFNITYPSYAGYLDLDNMWQQIQKENSATLNFIKDNSNRITEVKNNTELCMALNIQYPKDTTLQDYGKQDIKVYVFK